jgi:hypothetical protein
MLVEFDGGRPAATPPLGQGSCEYGYQAPDLLVQQLMRSFQAYHRYSTGKAIARYV